MRAATLRRIDLLCSSSEELGSFISRNILQGSSLHAPQFSKFFLFTAQSYRGQTFSGIISFAQKVDPFTFRHPVQLLLKNSHSSHFNPQADNIMVFKFYCKVQIPVKSASNMGKISSAYLQVNDHKCT